MAQRSTQQKVIKIKAHQVEMARELSEKAYAFKQSVQIDRPMHKRAAQRTRLLAHW